MTIKYRLFGKPGNIDEFMEKIKATGETKTNIELLKGAYYRKGYTFVWPTIIGRQRGKYGFDDEARIRFRVILSSRNGIKLLLKESIYAGRISASDDAKREMFDQSLKIAMKSAKKLQTSGLETTVNGIPMGKCSRLLKTYREYDHNSYFRTYSRFVTPLVWPLEW